MTKLHKKILTAAGKRAYKKYVICNRKVKDAEAGLHLFKAVDEFRRRIGYVK